MAAVESIGVESEEWALAHEALSKLRLKRAGLDAEEGSWLLRAFRAATHVYFGHASFGEYVERLFGLNRRTTEEKLRVAEALEELPELDQALRSGHLNWSVVRELTRVAAPDTESEWIAAVRRKTVREVERMVSGLALGDRPTDRRRPELVRHILRLEVGAETLAAFREAMRVLRKRSDHRLDDDATLLSMAREVLGGPSQPGRASYQIVVTQCEDCGRAFQHANGELIQLDPAIVEMCHCDAQNVPIAPPNTVAPAEPDRKMSNSCNLAQDRTHRGNASELTHADAGAGNASGPTPSHTNVGHGELADADTPTEHTDELAQSLAHEGESGELAPTQTHVGEAEELALHDVQLARAAGTARQIQKRQRATQNTPPAIRRQVFCRDRGRCIVPGCRNATYVDLHHLDLRSEGGNDDPDNLVVLCGAHHAAAHRGRIRIDGKVSSGLRVRHADGTAYGFVPSPTLADASAKTFAALRNLGYPEKTARSALERALAEPRATVAKEALLRSALAHASHG